MRCFKMAKNIQKREPRAWLNPHVVLDAEYQNKPFENLGLNTENYPKLHDGKKK